MSETEIQAKAASLVLHVHTGAERMDSDQQQSNYRFVSHNEYCGVITANTNIAITVLIIIMAVANFTRQIGGWKESPFLMEFLIENA